MKTRKIFSLFITLLMAVISFDCYAQGQTGYFTEKFFDGMVRYRASNLDSNKQSGFVATLPGHYLRLRLTKDSSYIEATNPIVINTSLFYKENPIAGAVLTSDSNGMATWQTLSATASLSIGDTITNANTGSVLFTTANGVLSQDSSVLNFNNTTKNLAVGTIANGSSRLLIRGVDATSSNYALRVQNNDVTPLEVFNVRNDGNVGLGTSSPSSQLEIENISSTTARPLITIRGGATSNAAILEFYTTSTLRTRIITNANGNAGLQFQSDSHQFTFRAIGGGAGVGFTISGNAGSGGLSLSPNGTLPITTDRLSIRNLNNSQNFVIRNNGQIGVDDLTTGAVLVLAASALVDLQSTTKGFLPPRMTSSQRNSIATPADGLIIFCTDCTATDTTTGVTQTYSSAAWRNHY